MVVFTLGRLLTINCMVKVCINGLMVESTKECGKKTLLTARALLCGQTAAGIAEFTRKTKKMVTVFTSTLTATNILDCGKTDFNTASEYLFQPAATSTKVSGTRENSCTG